MMNERYPIGEFDIKVDPTQDNIQSWLKDIKMLPTLLKEVVQNLDEEQVNTPYREGGWTVRQVVHHIADSHMNAFVRFKLALTEELPVIKPYDEQRWAELPDYELPVEVSLSLIEALHKRWVIVLSSLVESDFQKCFMHPELGEIAIGKNIGLYAWHGNHHLAHITSLCQRKGW
ncbi:hypothetical protein JCM9157_2835 [Halalkalibacter akibai JCM 9157]|uniref:Putative metal-dependent hydrolase JCM9157_2835 n=2 Tax=Halalkalibacter akibai TaxID=1411 RepID=W4QWK9_HALA3|nr:hypothetical protein JCM9157_2835 [Halalkalibacter akibai JCM 9157]